MVADRGEMMHGWPKTYAMSMQQDENYPVRITIPMHLYTRLMDAISYRAMHLVVEKAINKERDVSQKEDRQAIRQARAEALQEAIEDWLAKPKDAKWL